MDWRIPADERPHLRALAERQASYAALPVMRERERMWFDLNEGRRGSRPPVVVETWTFDRDFLPPAIFRCASPAGRQVEEQLLRNVREHELIDDDKVTPATFDVKWHYDIDEMGVPLRQETIPDAQGVDTGFRFLHPIADLERDFHLLQPAVCRVDREGTLAWQAELNEVFGDVLPVRIVHGLFEPAMLTHRVVELMGMEAYFVAMFEATERLHALMAFLRDNALRIMRWAETEGLLRLNNDHQESFGSSSSFTTQLPAAGFTADHVRLQDLWGFTNSQESVGVSPRTFHEFCYPYYREVCEPFGLLYYGCCEPTHPYWDDIRRLPHLRKVSISPWCDQRFMGEALRGTDIVFSRKPDPKYLGVAETLDEEAWGAHIRETLDATHGVLLEIICRDVYTVHGDIGNARRAVEVARREIDRAYRP